jgi:hypothetical protein
VTTGPTVAGPVAELGDGEESSEYLVPETFAISREIAKYPPQMTTA